MDLLYVIYTHNRPIVLQECVRTLFGNNELRPDRIVVIDDGSTPDVKESIYRQLHVGGTGVDFVSFKPNVGYGRAAEIGFAMADMFDPQICFFIESDYVFRKHGLDEVVDVLKSDLGRHSAGVVGYSHPDFFDPRSTDPNVGAHRRTMLSIFGEDNQNRALLHRPFPVRTRFGRVDLQFVSSSCGTMYLNWRLVAEMRRAFYPRMERDWVQATCCKGRPMRLLDDGVMSQGLAYFWTAYAKLMGWDTGRLGPLIDIMPSVANHLSAGGISVQVPGLGEGQTTVGSPSFPTNYDVYPAPSATT